MVRVLQKVLDEKVKWKRVVGDKRKQEILLSEDLRSCLLTLLFAVQFHKLCCFTMG